MSRQISILALVLAGAACTQPAQLAPDQLGPDYTTGGGHWSTGGGITVAVRAVERGGVTAICGAWSTDRQSTLSHFLNENVIEAGSVYLGGQRALMNLGALPRLPEGGVVAGAPAACAASALPWRPDYATIQPVVRLPRMAFPRDDDLDVSTQVVFNPGPRPPVAP